MLPAFGVILNTMKTTIIKALPILLLVAVGLWFLHSYNTMKTELSQAKWDLAGMTNRAESAEYNLAQEKKWQEEREAWKKELDAQFKEFDTKLLSYTQQLKGIKDERNKTGVNNALSEPVTRVLKQYTNTSNKD